MYNVAQPTCLAQMTEPETGGRSLTLLILKALLYGYWICRTDQICLILEVLHHIQDYTVGTTTIFQTKLILTLVFSLRVTGICFALVTCSLYSGLLLYYYFGNF